MMHLIRSKHTGGELDHSRNPLIYQLTNSAISHTPVSGEAYHTLLEHVQGDQLDLGLTDLWQADFDPDAPLDPAEFAFDTEQGEHYVAENAGVLFERNFGRVKIERVGPRRRYNFYLFGEGEQTSLVQMLDLDLDARPVQRRSLLGDVLQTEGQLTLLRVHDLRTGYGPSTDPIDGEVIVQLDREPDRAFGFHLRRDANEPTHRKMLALLPDAFNRNTQVRLAYRRTGVRNGEIIRVMNVN